MPDVITPTAAIAARARPAEEAEQSFLSASYAFLSAGFGLQAAHGHGPEQCLLCHDLYVLLDVARIFVEQIEDRVKFTPTLHECRRVYLARLHGYEQREDDE